MLVFVRFLFWFACTCIVSMQVAADKKTTILFLGDSLTAGYGIEQQQAYPALVGKQLAQQGHQVRIINAGVSGSTSASAEGRLRWYLQTKPDILILALGANDGLRGLPTTALQDNLQKTIALARSQGMRVILAGMHVPPNYGQDYAQAFHQVFQDLSKIDGVHFVPFLLQGVAGEVDYNLADGIHPNEAGHKKIAETMLNHTIAVMKGAAE